MAESDPLVSCLCVTHQRVPLLRRSVGCFLRQTLPARELIVLHESGDAATREYIASLDEPTVRTLEVPPLTLSLGAKRNAMVQAARGHYVATWDDDDWHGPGRLEEQLRSMREVGRPGCLLPHVLSFDGVSGQAWLACGRGWECTLAAEREAMPPYADVSVGEDLPCVEQLAAAGGGLALLSAPQLYIYNYHGRNTSTRTHFRKRVFGNGQPLNAAGCARVVAVMNDPAAPAPTIQEVTSWLAK